MFGSSTAPQSSFSWSKPADSNVSSLGNVSTSQQPGLFGASQSTSSNTMSSSNNLINNNNNNNNTIFNSSVTNSIAPNQVRKGDTIGSVTEHLVKIKEAWDPSSPNCAFQYYFYNKVAADEAMLYVKPAEQDQVKWDEAMKERPDTSSVPVLAVGFGDLQKRMTSQEQQVLTYQARMHELNDKLDYLTTRHDLHTTVKMEETKAKHAELTHRTLRLAVRAQVLRNRGLLLRTDEEALKEKLENLTKEVENPAVYGRINEIWARMTALREMARVMNNNQTNDIQDIDELKWDRDDEEVEKLTHILKDQQAGIAYLSKILSEDREEIGVLISKLETKMKGTKEK